MGSISKRFSNGESDSIQDFLCIRIIILFTFFVSSPPEKSYPSYSKWQKRIFSGFRSWSNEKNAWKFRYISEFYKIIQARSILPNEHESNTTYRWFSCFVLNQTTRAAEIAHLHIFIGITYFILSYLKTITTLSQSIYYF